jgi:hypothetical protein
MILIYGIFIFELVLIGASYMILKHYGFKKTGIAISLILTLIFLLPIFLYAFESQLYFKSDARNDLKLAGVFLNDDFEIESNEIVGLTDYYQTTKLKVSDRDRNSLIEKIKNHKNFEILDLGDYEEKNLRYKNGKAIVSYLAKDEYIRETYLKGKGYSRIQIILSVKEKSNILLLSRNEY